MPMTVKAKTPMMGLDGSSDELNRKEITHQRTNIVWKVADGVEL